MLTCDKFARLRLARSDRIGPLTFAHLIARFGDAEAAIEALPALAARGGGRAPAIACRSAIEREMETVARLGARYLFLGLPDYPPLLAETDGAPPVLIAKGDVGLVGRSIVAIVGARNASAAACRFARQIALALGEAGTVVASGLARGIDSAAHDGSIGTGTIAVIAGGIDIVYPPENAARQEAIAECGLVLAEQPPGIEPRARHFPSRNRIIAGIAHGTLVVEAAPRSGSLITARHAAEYGREVMAVPGSPIDPRAQGCNQLIREGGTLVQTAEDVLEALQPFRLASARESKSGYVRSDGTEEADEAARRQVFDLLGATAVAVDEIIRQSGLPAALVAGLLLELEVAGRVERHAGGRVSLL